MTAPIIDERTAAIRDSFGGTDLSHVLDLATIGQIAVEMFQCDPRHWRYRLGIDLADVIDNYLDGLLGK